MDSLPDTNEHGQEVIVKFKAFDENNKPIDNNSTFYTDSNGLEMQKRILNYRPTWDINANYNDSLKNITANYYPINSAISMKDENTNTTFIVMNDRA